MNKTKNKQHITTTKDVASSVAPEVIKAIHENLYKALSGSKEEEVVLALFNQTKETLWLAHDTAESREHKITGMLKTMQGINPACEVEGMLAAQMIATHNAAMECFRRGMFPDQSFEVRIGNLNQANKLVRSYATLVESLAKYKNKGTYEQKITVQHVHVTDGGQAIIGM